MKDKRLDIRLSKDIREQLEAIAEKENRTLSNLVETILKDYLKGGK